MKRFGIILLSAILLMTCGGCKRRPFADYRSKVAINLCIKTDIINHTEVELPENMRVDLYDPQTAQLVYTDYVGPTGGYIHPSAGVYDMIIYSIGSESTIIRNEHDYNEIEAYTNEVSDFLKSQISQFLDKRKQAASEPHARGPEQYVEDPVVNQPDHFFVGWYHNLEVPVIYEYDQVKEILVEVEAHTLVETWIVEVRNIEGTQWINSMAALISGQRGSVHIGPNVASEKVVSLYFDLNKARTRAGEKIGTGRYNTFGAHSSRQEEILIDISVKDTGGNEHIFHFDVSDQIVDNDERLIIIDEPIVIEEPKVEGGGFRPVVDDWDDVTTDIVL